MIIKLYQYNINIMYYCMHYYNYADMSQGEGTAVFRIQCLIKNDKTLG